MRYRFITVVLLVFSIVGSAIGQTFNKIELLVPEGKKVAEHSVTVTFLDDRIEIAAKGSPVKSFRYNEIREAEYSYTKNPRWKTGMGIGAASLVFPPLLLIALPIAFSKHRRHWLMIRTGDDFAVLKLSKSNRKLIIPTFETRSGVNVAGVGDQK